MNTKTLSQKWTTIDNTDVEMARNLPKKSDIYEWRVPSVIVPGMHVIFQAVLRLRGGCGENFLSPPFDHWNGWRAIIPAGSQWRPAPEGSTALHGTYAFVRPEGVDPDPCPFCGKTPTFEGHETGGSRGVVICGVPHRFDSWTLNCCSWARSPRMRNPIELVAQRRSLLYAHRTATKAAAAPRRARRARAGSVNV